MVTVTFPDGEHETFVVQDLPPAPGILLARIATEIELFSWQGEIDDTGGYVRADEDSPIVRFVLS